MSNTNNNNNAAANNAAANNIATNSQGGAMWFGLVQAGRQARLDAWWAAEDPRPLPLQVLQGEHLECLSSAVADAADEISRLWREAAPAGRDLERSAVWWVPRLSRIVHLREEVACLGGCQHPAVLSADREVMRGLEAWDGARPAPMWLWEEAQRLPQGLDVGPSAGQWWAIIATEWRVLPQGCRRKDWPHDW